MIHKTVSGDFVEYRYRHFEKWQEFALDDGIIFDTLTNNDDCHAG